MTTPIRPPRLRRGALLGATAIAVSAVVLIALSLGLVEKSRADTAVAQKIAAAYPVPTLTSPPSRIITVIGAELTLPAAADGDDSTAWPAMVGNALDYRVFVNDSGGSYVRGPKGLAKFSNHGGMVAPRASAVVFFGGRYDAGVPRSTLLKAAAGAYAAATATAPYAKQVVIGPVSTTEVPSQQVLDVRDTLRTATGRTHATFVDPIAEDWFPAGSGAFTAAGAFTSKGQQLMAQHVERALRPLLSAG